MANDKVVYLVDDNQDIIKSLSWLISSVGYKVSAFTSAESFLASFQENDCAKCLVLDVRMPGMSGLELQQKFKLEKINIPIIFISGHGDIPMAVQTIKSGALEFLTKPLNDQKLLDTIYQAFAIDIRKRKRSARRQKILTRFETLTPREREVMGLSIEGHTSKQIAKQLEISPHTTELHRAKVMKKMACNNIAEVVNTALKYQLFEDKVS